MTTEQAHPSFFSLDRMALGLPVEAAVEAHVAECDVCTRHITSVGTAPGVPAWANALDVSVPSEVPGRKAARIPPWAMGATGVLALAAVALLTLRAGPSGIAERSDTSGGAASQAPAEHTTLRGAPSVGLHINRGGRVSLWDGHRPVAPGDRLRLEVVPEGFTHVAVFTPDGRGSFQTLYTAPVDPSETLLPRAWEVDAAGDAESLVIVLSMRAISAEEVEGLIDRASPDGSVWLRTLSIPKDEVAP